MTLCLLVIHFTVILLNSFLFILVLLGIKKKREQTHNDQLLTLEQSLICGVVLVQKTLGTTSWLVLHPITHSTVTKYAQLFQSQIKFIQVKDIIVSFKTEKKEVVKKYCKHLT